MKTCLAILLSFMSDKAGMPGVEQGWVVQAKDKLVYTWYTENNSVKFLTITDKITVAGFQEKCIHEGVTHYVSKQTKRLLVTK